MYQFIIMISIFRYKSIKLLKKIENKLIIIIIIIII